MLVMSHKKNALKKPPVRKTAQKRLLHVAAGCWKDGGGLSEAVAQLILAQTRAGEHVTLAFIGGEEEHPVLSACRNAGAEIITCPPTGPRRLYFSSELNEKLPQLVKNSDFIHIHGGWTPPLWRAAACAARAGVPYAVSLHGTLGPLSLAKGKWRKKLCWNLFDRKMLRRATWLHAATEIEADWIRGQLGNNTPPIRVVPWGVNREDLTCPPQVRTQTLLFLGRRHPVKGLDLLARAWKNVPYELKCGWKLLIIGPDEGARFPVSCGIKIEPPIYGQAKAERLRQAHALILPSRSENFGFIVAEALCCGTPVLCTDGVPWMLPAGFRVAGTAEALTDGLCRLMSASDAELRKLFEPLYADVRKHCTWDTVAQQLKP